jgi:hypothetical protein
METFKLEKDIQVFCVTADSFPFGVMEAHQKLRSLVPSDNRRFFGISRPKNGGIEYKASAEEMKQGEAEKLGCESFTIKAGNYSFTIIKDFMKDTSLIGKVFQQLLANPVIDPQGYCLEWYLGDKDVRCMVKLNS